MSKRPQQPIDVQLEQTRDQLRAEIREGRETLADLHAAIRDARDLLPRLTADRISDEVTTQLERLGDATQKAMNDSVERVIREFDKLHDTLTGTDHASRRAGRPSIPDLIRIVGTRQTPSGRTCGASSRGPFGALLGPCVLAPHEGPVHQDATGCRYTLRDETRT